MCVVLWTLEQRGGWSAAQSEMHTQLLTPENLTIVVLWYPWGLLSRPHRYQNPQMLAPTCADIPRFPTSNAKPEDTKG